MRLVHLCARDLEGACVTGLKRLSFEKGLLEGAGVLESPVQEAAFPFDRLLGSWTAQTPAGASVEMRVQVRSEGAWSGWFRLPRWEEGASTSFSVQPDAFGRVCEDTLILARKADAFRYRLILEGGQGGKPRLHRVCISYDDASLPLPPEPPFTPGPWVREIPLTPRSQMEEQERWRRDLCSPTSLAMVLEHYGKKLSTGKAALLVRDHGAGIFGNWTLNVAAAGSLGLCGEAAWLPSFSDLQEEIAHGRPTAVSLTFAEGELSGAPLKKTRGHLVVVSGFTPSGDVIVCDPAAPERSSVRRVYLRSEFERAWLRNKRGLCYLIGEPFPQELRAAVPTADLRTAPRESARPEAMDRSLGTQLLYGERVLVLSAKGNWARVEALDQEYFSDGRWSGYPGWVRAEDLSYGLRPYRPGSVLRAKRTEIPAEEGRAHLTLPLGVLLAAEGGAPKDTVALLDGRRAHVEAGHLRPLSPQPPAIARRHILETAALFLGDRYVWGGRSSVQKRPGWGVDCSGLANLSYLAAGLRIPRNAHDQHLRARALRKEELQPGDLVFLTSGEKSEAVDHVMLYAGGDGLIESRATPGKTLRTTFTERFGTPLSSLSSADILTDLSGRKPLKRRILFGAFLP
ncbi:MAG: NlpC/P60 family protein [Elusimicrobiota bacterium]|jgi:hypothetical protein